MLYLCIREFHETSGTPANLIKFINLCRKWWAPNGTATVPPLGLVKWDVHAIIHPNVSVCAYVQVNMCVYVYIYITDHLTWQPEVQIVDGKIVDNTLELGKAWQKGMWMYVVHIHVYMLTLYIYR